MASFTTSMPGDRSGSGGNRSGSCVTTASLAMHAEDGLSRLPVVTHQPLRFPPEPVRSPGMLVVNHAIRRKDDAEDEGRTANPFVAFAARIPRRLGYNLGPR